MRKHVNISVLSLKCAVFGLKRCYLGLKTANLALFSLFLHLFLDRYFCTKLAQNVDPDCCAVNIRDSDTLLAIARDIYVLHISAWPRQMCAVLQRCAVVYIHTTKVCWYGPPTANICNCNYLNSCSFSWKTKCTRYNQSSWCNLVVIVQGIEPWIMLPQNKAFQLSLSYTNRRDDDLKM